MYAPTTCYDKEEGIHYVTLLKECAKRKDLEKGMSLHVDITNKCLLRKNPYVGSSLINMYAKCGALSKAQEVLDELPFRNIVSWSALIAGYSRKGHGHEALNCFERMQSEGLSPDEITLTCILKACGSTQSLDKGKQIHEFIVTRLAWERYYFGQCPCGHVCQMWGTC